MTKHNFSNLGVRLCVISCSILTLMGNLLLTKTIAGNPASTKIWYWKESSTTYSWKKPHSSGSCSNWQMSNIRSLSPKHFNSALWCLSEFTEVQWGALVFSLGRQSMVVKPMDFGKRLPGFEFWLHCLMAVWH